MHYLLKLIEYFLPSSLVLHWPQFSREALDICQHLIVQLGACQAKELNQLGGHLKPMHVSSIDKAGLADLHPAGLCPELNPPGDAITISPLPSSFLTFFPTEHGRQKHKTPAGSDVSKCCVAHLSSLGWASKNSTDSGPSIHQPQLSSRACRATWNMLIIIWCTIAHIQLNSCVTLCSFRKNDI